MYRRALSYYTGQSATKDYALARQWFEKAAARGSAAAMWYLGVIYHNGLGVAQGLHRRRANGTKAAAAGNADAMR